MSFTSAQQWALVLVPKITGFISLVFSGLVILTVCRCREKRSKTYHRLLLGISCVDVSSSFWLGISTWPIPAETGILGASGNTTSCTIQGFFTQFGVASSFYNASLSIFYLLVIRCGWKEDRIVKIEPWLHAIPIVWALSTAIAGVPLTLYNSANLWCWIAPYQDRGANADLYRWIFFYGPLWMMILITTISVILIFQHVRQLERKSQQYTFRKQQQLQQQSCKLSRHFQADDFRINYNSSTNELMDQSSARQAVKVGEEEDISDDNNDNNIDVGIAEVEPGPDSTTEDTTLPPSERRKPIESSLSNNSKGGLAAAAMSFRRSKKTPRNRSRRSREVAYQSLRYAGSFYFTWIALTVRLLVCCREID